MMRISRNERGSLPLAMLLTLVGVGLTGLIGTTVIGQVTTSRYDGERAAAMDAAQSGIETALAQMRALPIYADGDARRTDLPCATTSTTSPDLTIAGRVSPGSPAAYSVNVYYVSLAPPSTTDAEAWARSNRIGCVAGIPATAPMYALLAATGTSGAENRSVTATYLFQSHTKANVPGGTIKVYNSDQCLTAPRLPADPVPLTASTQVVLATCSATDPKQIFTYNPTLQVELKATEGSVAFPHGACLQAVNTDHSPVVFADCDTTKLNYTQVWSLNNRDNFEGTLNGTGNDGKCVNVDWTAAPPALVINNVIQGNTNRVANTAGDGTDGTPCSGTSGDYTRYKTFFPDASAGTGAAGPVTRQLVNYDEFGRCLDVTGNNVGSAFLVVFPCKQTPDPNGIQWNQVWYLPGVPATDAAGNPGTSGTGWLTLTGSDKVTKYCLTSPGSTAAGQYVRVYQCTPTAGATPPANQNWTRRVFTGVNQTSYRIESTFGTNAGNPYCLLPSPSDYWDQFTAMKISKLVLAPCDGSNLQKWNASPSILTSVVSDYREK
ncbi:RICIN domain-containing protein [Actinoplanes sp. NPDC051343]|uniref:RICIN domain-containing protein n=1 Tax=Actinoplanes sp. NPDC051343 TaxID=3363906 RepID=UPI0037A48F5E